MRFGNFRTFRAQTNILLFSRSSRLLLDDFAAKSNVKVEVMSSPTFNCSSCAVFLLVMLL